MKPKHWLIFILLGAIWSSSFMWIKLALRELNPVAIVAVRVTLGFIFGAAVIIVTRTKLPKKFKAWMPLLLLGLTNFAAPFFLISWGEKSIDSSVASVLDATVPLFTIFIAHYLLHDDKMTMKRLSGLIMGFAGVIVLLSKNIGASSSTLLGEAAVVLASVFYAGSAVFIRKTTQNIPGVLRSTIPMLSASLVMWIVALTIKLPVHIPKLELTWIALLFIGLIGSGLAFLMAFYLIHEIGPTRSTMVTYIFPLGGVLLGVIFLHEQITWQLIIGGILILSSLVIVNLNISANLSLRRIKAEV